LFLLISKSNRAKTNKKKKENPKMYRTVCLQNQEKCCQQRKSV